MQSIVYPNHLEDIAVVNYRGGARIGFTIRPKTAGYFRLLIWPDGIPDPDLIEYTSLLFRNDKGPPVRREFDLSDHNARAVQKWCWSLVKASPQSTALSDLANIMLGSSEVVGGHFTLDAVPVRGQTRTALWSCHMPYETDANQAVLQENAEDILFWYAEQIAEYKPHVIWGAGDNGYSDGTEGTDFSNQVYEKGNWFHNPANREWLKNEYRRMYRQFWSFEPMRKVMKDYPHLFIWDDHEIHDGWGSEGIDFKPGNLEMFKIARQVAQEYILNAGPRMRPTGEEAHQAYIHGSVACFIFDTRSTRNYEANRERLISREQFRDFQLFLDAIQSNGNITDVITCTTVPFVNMRTWVMELGSNAPDFLNDNLIQGVRDDIRDSWTSPGNIDTLERVLNVIGRFMNRRLDINVWNVSGDIHVANAYEIYIPGVYKPVRQVTTSAITNRHHPPELVEVLTEIGDGTYIKGVGQVNRIWPTITEPNVLFMTTGPDGSEARLKVWSEDYNEVNDRVIQT
jgi:hypothetical protein